MEYMLLFMLVIFSASAVIEGFFAFSAMRRAYERSFMHQLILIPVKTNMKESIEGIIREALAMAERSYLSIRIILYDMGADEETMQICRRLTDENDIMEIRSCGEDFLFFSQ